PPPHGQRGHLPFHIHGVDLKVPAFRAEARRHWRHQLAALEVPTLPTGVEGQNGGDRYEPRAPPLNNRLARTGYLLITFLCRARNRMRGGTNQDSCQQCGSSHQPEPSPDPGTAQPTASLRDHLTV